MSHSTNGPGPTRRSMREGSVGEGRPDVPWQSVAPAHGADDGGADDGGTDDSGGADGRGPFWRRLPVWAYVVAAAVLVGVVVLVLVLLNRPGSAEELEPEVVTLPVPTPTIDAIERDEGTPFFESLPSTVLVWALAEYAEDEDLLIAGAVEAYLMTYSDGERTLTVQAGQWPTADAADAALEQLLTQAGEAEDAAADDAAGEDAADEVTDDAAGDEATDDSATDEGATIEPEEGVVEVDGTQVGRYVLRPTADGAGELWWTNQSVLIRIQGPAEDIRDVFAGFPL